MSVKKLAIVVWFLCLSFSLAEMKKVKVFIALCDNETQGIVPVGAKIGDGNVPDANLYWGCSDGFGRFFVKSKNWKTESLETDVDDVILKRLTMSHVKGDVHIIAEAYRGSQIKKCLAAFEVAAANNTYDLVAFIGHNGLMDFTLQAPEAEEGNNTAVIVLCCLSDKYFTQRLSNLGCQPILMTKQFMYPGSFILEAAIEKWRNGNNLADIRNAAGKAYAKNQKISLKAATGVFSDLEAK